MKNAFTLVEVIIVLLIVGILFGISVSSYRRLNDIKALETQTESVIELIEYTKSKALLMDISDLSLLPTDAVQNSGDTIQTQRVNYYEISFSSNPYNLIISANYCVDFDCTAPPTNKNIRQYEFPSGFVVNPSTSSIRFPPKKTSMDTPFIVLIKHIQLNKCKLITVSTSLLVTSEDVTCP